MIRAESHAFRVSREFIVPPRAYYEFTLNTLLLTKHKHPVLFYIFVRYITYVSIRFSSIVLSTVVYIFYFLSLISLLLYDLSLLLARKMYISFVYSDLESALNFRSWFSTFSSVGRKSLRQSLGNLPWMRMRSKYFILCIYNFLTLENRKITTAWFADNLPLIFQDDCELFRNIKHKNLFI